MKLRVLGCSGTEAPGHNASSFPIGDTLLLDAGTTSCSALDPPERLEIRSSPT